MKKYLWIVSIFLLFPLNVVAKSLIGMGDSITTGYGVSENESYFNLLCQHLSKEGNFTCDNLANNGLTSTQFLEQLKDDIVIQKIRVVDYVVFSIGGNDFLQELISNLFLYLNETSNFTNFNQVKNKLLNNLELICKKFKEENPNVELLIIPLYNPYATLLESNETLIANFKEAQQEYATVAKKYGKIPEKIGEMIQDKKYLNASAQNLDPHPTIQGHELIANAVAETLDVTLIQDQKMNYFYIITPIVIIMIGSYLVYKKFHKV